MDDPYFDPFTLYVYEDVEVTLGNIKTEPPDENSEVKNSPSDLVSPDNPMVEVNQEKEIRIEADNEQTNAVPILHVPKLIKDDDFSFTQDINKNLQIKAEPLPETDDRILELIKSEENKPKRNNFGNAVIKLESDDENDDLMIENGLFSSKQHTITNHLENMSQYIPNFKIKENRDDQIIVLSDEDDDDVTIIEDESSRFNISLKTEKADANIADEDIKVIVESDKPVTVIDFGKNNSTKLLQNGLVTSDGNPIREEISHPLNLSENPAIKALSTVDTSNKTPNQISVLGFSKDTENMDLNSRISKQLIGLSFKELLKSSANRTANTPSSIETVDTDKNNIADVQIENYECQKSLNGTLEVDLSAGKLRGLIQNKMCKTAVSNKTNDKRDVNVKKRMEEIHDNLRDRNNSKRTQIKTYLGTHQATSTGSKLKRKYGVSPNRNSSFLVNSTNSGCNIGKDKAQKVDLRHEQNRRNNYENVSPSMVVPNSKKLKISRDPHKESNKNGIKFCLLNNTKLSDSKFKSNIFQNGITASPKSMEKPSTASSTTNIVDVTKQVSPKDNPLQRKASEHLNSESTDKKLPKASFYHSSNEESKKISTNIKPSSNASSHHSSNEEARKIFTNIHDIVKDVISNLKYSRGANLAKSPVRETQAQSKNGKRLNETPPVFSKLKIPPNNEKEVSKILEHAADSRFVPNLEWYRPPTLFIPPNPNKEEDDKLKKSIYQSYDNTVIIINTNSSEKSAPKKESIERKFLDKNRAGIDKFREKKLRNIVERKSSDKDRSKSEEFRETKRRKIEENSYRQSHQMDGNSYGGTPLQSPNEKVNNWLQKMTFQKNVAPSSQTGIQKHRLEPRSNSVEQSCSSTKLPIAQEKESVSLEKNKNGTATLPRRALLKNEIYNKPFPNILCLNPLLQNKKLLEEKLKERSGVRSDSKISKCEASKATCSVKTSHPSKTFHKVPAQLVNQEICKDAILPEQSPPKDNKPEDPQQSLNDMTIGRKHSSVSNDYHHSRSNSFPDQIISATSPSGDSGIKDEKKSFVSIPVFSTTTQSYKSIDFDLETLRKLRPSNVPSNQPCEITIPGPNGEKLKIAIPSDAPDHKIPANTMTIAGNTTNLVDPTVKSEFGFKNNISLLPTFEFPDFPNRIILPSYATLWQAFSTLSTILLEKCQSEEQTRKRKRKRKKSNKNKGTKHSSV